MSWIPRDRLIVGVGEGMATHDWYAFALLDGVEHFVGPFAGGRADAADWVQEFVVLVSTRDVSAICRHIGTMPPPPADTPIVPYLRARVPLSGTIPYAPETVEVIPLWGRRARITAGGDACGPSAFW